MGVLSAVVVRLMAYETRKSHVQYKIKAVWYRRRIGADMSRLVYEDTPAGILWCRYMGEFTASNQDYGGAFGGDQTIVMVRTWDTTEGLNPKDRIVMRGKTYIVDSIRRTPEMMSMDDRRPAVKSDISLRGA